MQCIEGEHEAAAHAWATEDDECAENDPWVTLSYKCAKWCPPMMSSQWWWDELSVAVCTWPYVWTLPVASTAVAASYYACVHFWHVVDITSLFIPFMVSLFNQYATVALYVSVWKLLVLPAWLNYSRPPHRKCTSSLHWFEMLISFSQREGRRYPLFQTPGGQSTLSSFQW